MRAVGAGLKAQTVRMLMETMRSEKTRRLDMAHPSLMERCECRIAFVAIVSAAFLAMRRASSL
jgi:hypothetical protein